jgi:23S rRNA pseudouridine2605 synthase
VDSLRERLHFSRVFVPRRLDKYLRDSTTLSLTEIRDACVIGRVALSSSESSLGEPICPERLVYEDDIVRIDGHVVSPKTEHHYLVMNKPRFITTTARDPDGRTDLSRWLRQMPEGVFPVGRLDRETSGALLFTDDGDFANAILQPEHHTEKRYWLWLDDVLNDNDPRLYAFINGVPSLSDDKTLLRATSVSVHHRTSEYTELHVTLDEGKNRHIRKMCHLLGLHLLELHRKAIGTLSLGELPIGHFRFLQSKELENLWASCGGKERVVETKLFALTQLAASNRETARPDPRLEDWLRNVRDLRQLERLG